MGFASVNGIVVPAEEARVSRPRQRLRLRGQRLRGAADLRRARLRAGPALPPAARLGRPPRLLRPGLGRRPARAGGRPPRPGGEPVNPTSESSSAAASGTARTTSSGSQGPTVVMIQKPLPPYPAWHYEDGIQVAAVGVRRNHPRALDPAIKSSNLLNNILAVREAQSRGAEEPVLLNQEGFLAEGASTNVFLAPRGHALHSPALGGHPGRHHARGGARAAAGPRHPLPRGAAAPRRPARRRRGVHDQHHPRGGAGAAGGRDARSGRPARARSPGA